ncbi:MAG: hypothetical protein LUQ03_02245 [Methanomicrobiales archaeon]|jgi:hypothetical protein|nr:hypothetical protein [Methanomicrobiales archaeon]
MHVRILTLLALALACVILAGCAAPPEETPTPTPTTLPTTVPVTATTTAPPSLEPGPTVTSPLNLDTIITVTRNPISAYPDIIVTYGGGSGNLLLQWLDIKVTRSDGIVETAQITRPSSGTIPMGSSVTLAGTNGSDRVEVTAWYYGNPYKIYDALVPAASRP